MNTKKDYIRAAMIVRNVTEVDRGAVCDAFAEFFCQDNPRFDLQRFNKACLEGMVSERAGTRFRSLESI